MCLGKVGYVVDLNVSGEMGVGKAGNIVDYNVILRNGFR